MSAKPIIFLILVFIFLSFIPSSSLAGSWNGWIYQNPYPTSNTLLAVKFITPQKGWVAGELGTILYTEDGGETWEVQESGTEQDIKSLAFVNEKQGWAVGNGGVIIYTEDGGKRWIAQSSDTNSSLNKVVFINEKEGWAVGNEGTVLQTSDGGKKWTIRDIGIQRSIASVYFLNPQTGWILAGDEVYRTTDGGKRWKKSSISIKIQRPTRDDEGYPVISIGGETIEHDWWQGDIYFTDEKNGWAVFGYWYISQTKDSGETWRTNEISHTIGNILFTGGNKGCAIGTSILCTEDGGKTWNERLGYKSSDLSIIALWGISFINQSIGWAVGKGGGGKIYKTEDGGKSWQVKSRGYEVFAYFLDSKTGWNVQYDFKLNKSSIVKTEDGGNTWEVQKIFDYRTHVEFFFINPTTGWAVGTGWGEQRGGGSVPLNYFVLYTNDGGKTWITQFDEPASKKDTITDGLFDVYFINSNIGWVVGSKGRILHTRDGGKHWERQQSGTKFRLRGVQFVDNKRGWVIGEDVTENGSTAVILHTDNGGKDWQIQWKKTTDWIGLNELQFIDSNIGWVGGEINEYSGDYILIYTTDGGKTWTEKEFKEIYHNRMIFLDKNQGVILTEKSHMLITKDGGETWERKIQPIRKYPWHISEVFKEKDK